MRKTLVLSSVAFVALLSLPSTMPSQPPPGQPSQRPSQSRPKLRQGTLSQERIEWLTQNIFDGQPPGEITVKNPVLANQEQSVRDLEIDPALYTPPDQMRPLGRSNREEIRMNMGGMIAGGTHYEKPPK